MNISSGSPCQYFKDLSIGDVFCLDGRPTEFMIRTRGYFAIVGTEQYFFNSIILKDGSLARVDHLILVSKYDGVFEYKGTK